MNWSGARAILLMRTSSSSFRVPAVVAALIWNYMLNDMLGVINYVLQSLHIISQPLAAMSTPSRAMNTIIVISSWKFVPFIIVMFLSRLQTLPLELAEAGRASTAAGRCGCSATSRSHGCCR